MSSMKPRAIIAPVSDVPYASVPFTVTLNGAGSLPSLGPPAAASIELYEWTLHSKPPGSNAVINNSSSSTPTITVDLAGSYLISLRVTDDQGRSSHAGIDPIQSPNVPYDFSFPSIESMVSVRVVTETAELVKVAYGERQWLERGLWPIVDKVEEHATQLAGMTAFNDGRYLAIDGKAVDADKLDGFNSDHFATKSSLDAVQAGLDDRDADILVIQEDIVDIQGNVTNLDQDLIQFINNYKLTPRLLHTLYVTPDGDDSTTWGDMTFTTRVLTRDNTPNVVKLVTLTFTTTSEATGFNASYLSLSGQGSLTEFAVDDDAGYIFTVKLTTFGGDLNSKVLVGGGYEPTISYGPGALIPSVSKSFSPLLVEDADGLYSFPLAQADELAFRIKPLTGAGVGKKIELLLRAGDYFTVSSVDISPNQTPDLLVDTEGTWADSALTLTQNYFTSPSPAGLPPDQYIRVVFFIKSASGGTTGDFMVRPFTINIYGHHTDLG